MRVAEHILVRLCVPFFVIFVGLGMNPWIDEARGQESTAATENRNPDSSATDEVERAPIAPLDGVEEIVIVGQASGLVAEDEATSAVAFNEEYLLDQGIQDIRDLSSYTPNLEIKTAFAAVNPTLFIRGVGLDDFNANSASAVSVYADGVYLYSPAGQLFGLFDVETVEVLRGPQPLYTNASAGAIAVRSRRPSENFEAHLTTTLGTPSRDGFFAGYNERTFQGALNIPIIPDRVSFRGSFKARQRDGTTENACGPRIRQANQIDGDDQQRFEILGTCVTAAGEGRKGAVTPPSEVVDYVNNIDNWAARGLLSVKMPLPGGQEIDWLLNVNGGQNLSLASQYQHQGLTRSVAGTEPPYRAGPQSTYTNNGRPALDRSNYSEEFTEGNNFAGEYDRIGHEYLDLLGASLTGNWQVTDTIDLESLSAYVWHDRKTYANDDGNPKLWLDSDYLDRSSQLSQDLRLRWLFGDENEVKVGGIFLWESLRGQNVFRNRRAIVTDPDGSQGYFAYEQSFTQRTRQWGTYVNAHIALSSLSSAGFLDDLDLDGTFRYNWSRKDFSQASIGVRGASSFPANVGAEDSTWTGITGDLALTYHFTEDKSAYVKYSRGWKPGHYNLGTLTSGEALSPVAPETIDSWELGLRTQWLDGLITANLTGFFYDYTNLQVFQTTVDARGNILRRLINAQSANIKGAEADLVFEPVEGMVLSLDAAYLSSEYEDFGTRFQRNRRVPGGDPSVQEIDIAQDYSGNRLIASPEWSFNANLSYLIWLGRFGSLRPWYNAAFKDEIFFGPNEGLGAEGTLVGRNLREPAYWLQNVGLTYTSPGSQWEVGVWIRNISNTNYRVQSFDLSNPNRFILNVYGDPRTAGFTVTLRFF